MSNGRMTFRFDVEKAKSDLEERWTGSGLSKNKEYVPLDRPIEVPQEPYDLYSNSEAPMQPPILSINEQVWNSSIYEDTPDEIYSGAYHSRKPFYGWKFVASVAAAIGIGLLFGYVALSFFRGGDLPNISVNGAFNQMVTGGQNTGDALEPAGTGTSGLPIMGEDSVGTLPAIPVQIAGQSYYLLQYGVFSTSQGASKAEQELLTAGLAAGLDPSDGNRVYAGISPDREQAKLLSNGLKAQGIELYVREVTIPATEQLTFGGTAESVNNYFAISNRILEKLSSLSATLLSNGTTASIDDVSSIHMEWTEAVKSLESGLPKTAFQIIAAQEKTVNQGISALNEYGKNKSDGLLWEVQAAMMSFLSGQKELLASLN
ncbi:SPOR domain-containing protein [Paenibacillus wynnii]|uniref:SPOR domain-containing protein n=1 Tax=Paenibacillus wynnii TaxID=268407 RepID=UPI00068FA85B|nr:SPOR domain-containing protein [Paenibacillus wynnii]